MRVTFSILLLLLISSGIIKAQETVISGKPVFELFTDFHYSILHDSTKTTGFNLKRAYFGYDYKINDKFSAEAIIDIGTPEDLAPGSKSRRYAHFREASIRYTGEKLTITAGITGTRIFAFQQKFWGKRYVANTYQSINGYGYVADLGVVADFVLNKHFSFDFSLTNGEGYSTLQLDNSVKGSAGATISPVESLVIRLYADYQKMEDISQATLVGFIGLRTDMFYIGGEASYKSNLDLTEGHHAWGISSTAGLNISDKNELFARVDYSTSVILPGNFLGWNNNKDGSFIIAGLQHTFNKNVKAAFNYQSFYPSATSQKIYDYLYLNILVKF